MARINIPNFDYCLERVVISAIVTICGLDLIGPHYEFVDDAILVRTGFYVRMPPNFFRYVPYYGIAKLPDRSQLIGKLTLEGSICLK